MVPRGGLRSRTPSDLRSNHLLTIQSIQPFQISVSSFLRAPSVTRPNLYKFNHRLRIGTCILLTEPVDPCFFAGCFIGLWTKETQCFASLYSPCTIDLKAKQALPRDQVLVRHPFILRLSSPLPTLLYLSL